MEEIATTAQLSEIEKRVETINRLVDLLHDGDNTLAAFADELANYADILEQSHKKIRRLEVGLRLVNRIAC